MKFLGSWGARKESAHQPGHGMTGTAQKQAHAGTFGSHPPRDRVKVQTGNGAADQVERLKGFANEAPSWARDHSSKAASAAAPAAVDRPVQNAWDLSAKDADSKYIGQPGPDAAPVSRDPATETEVSKAARTRLLGFDKSDGTSVDAFDQEPGAQSGRTTFPVGWIVVTDGPGRGHSFALHSGLSQIGRSDDQAVSLNFGDMAISRSNHAAIVFDTESNTFMVGHGGKANIVRLNGKPVIANDALKDGDVISIGETTLVLKTFCGPDFTWNEKEPELAEIPSIV